MSLFFARSSSPIPELSSDAPLVVLHPGASRTQHLLPYLLTQLPKHLHPIFVTIESPDCSASEFAALLGRAVHDQAGLTLNSADHVAFGKLGAFCLVIDAFDYLRELEFCTWLSAFVAYLPEGSRIVLNSRHLPRQLLVEATLRPKIALFPTDEEEMLIDYTQHPADRVLAEVYELGTGRALINGARIMQWDGMLPYTLFFTW